jgi:hypothetical protein
MAFCKSCGSPLEGVGKFCVRCGQSVDAPEPIAPETAAPPQPTYAPPASPPPAAAYAPPQSTYAQPAAYAPPPAYAPPATPGSVYAPPSYPPGAYAPPQQHRSLKWLWIGLAALVVVAAIAVVLVFVVFNGGDGAATGPEETVERLLSAMENQDLDAFLDLMDPSMKESLGTGDELEAARQEMMDSMFDFESIEFSNIKMSTEETGDTTATVSIVEGTVTMTNSDGETETDDIDEETDPVTFDLTKIDGKWYLDSGSFF